MGNYIIDQIANFFKIITPLLKFCLGRKFLLPPGYISDSIRQTAPNGSFFLFIIGRRIPVQYTTLDIMAGCPAKCKKAISFYRKHLPTFQKDNLIPCNIAYLAPIPPFQRILGNHRIILVISLYPEKLKRKRQKPL